MQTSLSAYMIHTVIYTNLNTIFYTHVEHRPTKLIYIKYYMETHTHTHTPQGIQTCMTRINYMEKEIGGLGKKILSDRTERLQTE